MTESILLTRDAANPAIATVTLNRPDKLNSFTGEMHAELRDALDAIQADADKAAAKQVQDEQNARLATAEGARKGPKPTQATAAFAATTE